MNPDYYESISLEQAKSIYDLALANFEKVKKKYSSRPFHFLNFRDISESDIGLLIHCAENILLSLRLESIVQEQYYNCKSAEEEKETLYYNINSLVVQIVDYLGRFRNTSFPRLKYTFPK